MPSAARRPCHPESDIFSRQSSRTITNSFGCNSENRETDAPSHFLLRPTPRSRQHVLSNPSQIPAMDIEISDILDSISYNPSTQPETADLQSLTRHWVAERSAPELLPWPGELMDRVLARLSKQIARVEDETGLCDPKRNFGLVVMQTEIERVRFLVRGVVRGRIDKVCICT
jgi:hypothetical protein